MAKKCFVCGGNRKCFKCEGLGFMATQEVGKDPHHWKLVKCIWCNGTGKCQKCG